MVEFMHAGRCRTSAMLWGTISANYTSSLSTAKLSKNKLSLEWDILVKEFDKWFGCSSTSKIRYKIGEIAQEVDI